MCAKKLDPEDVQLDVPSGVQVDPGLFILQESEEGIAPLALAPDENQPSYILPGSFADEELVTPPAADGVADADVHTLAEIEIAAQKESSEIRSAGESPALEEALTFELSDAAPAELAPEVRDGFTESEMENPEIRAELPDVGMPEGVVEIQSQTAESLHTQVEALDLGADFLSALPDGNQHEVAPAAVEPAPAIEAGVESVVAPTPGFETLDFNGTNPALPLANRDTYGAGQALSIPKFQEPIASSLAEAPAFAPGVASGPAGPQDLETVRRYAMLKEREALEKDSTIKALQNQMAQLRERTKRSDVERRRLQVALEESESVRRSLEDAREQHKHHVAKLESVHQEEQRALQMRLDNAQFQAAKADRKLEDFRERVRSDIQKIRSRERELSNRLELQKRDAEALLAVKDERLLQQKRELDRLEYELELLQERLVEETEKAEERISKLHRAVQAMRLAQGLLSGLEEEVLPGAASSSGSDDGGDQAA